MESMIGRKYGWRGAGVHDPRHLALRIPARVTRSLPQKVDLRDKSMPDVYDQGQFGACVANATAAVLQRLRRLEGLPDFTPSRMALYWNGRVIEGTTRSDSGLVITDEMKALTKFGYCDEALWPYLARNLYKAPPANVATDEAMRTAEKYQGLAQTQTDVLGALAMGLMPVFGMTVFASFESPQALNTGVIPMPKRNESVLGGHCVCACGYDLSANTLLCRNSWGNQVGGAFAWKERGYFTLPLLYAMDPQLVSGFEVVSCAAR